VDSQIVKDKECCLLRNHFFEDFEVLSNSSLAVLNFFVGL